MRKLKSVEEFSEFRQRVIAEKKMQYERPTLVVCAGTGGQASGSNPPALAMACFSVTLSPTSEYTPGRKTCPMM